MCVCCPAGAERVAAARAAVAAAATAAATSNGGGGNAEGKEEEQEEEQEEQEQEQEEQEEQEEEQEELNQEEQQEQQEEGDPGAMLRATVTSTFNTALASGGGEPLNRSKLCLVGEGRAGKTSVLRAMLGKPYERTASTVGAATGQVRH
jgi:hypothetical protein